LKSEKSEYFSNVAYKRKLASSLLPLIKPIHCKRFHEALLLRDSIEWPFSRPEVVVALLLLSSWSRLAD